MTEQQTKIVKQESRGVITSDEAIALLIQTGMSQAEAETTING